MTAGRVGTTAGRGAALCALLGLLGLVGAGPASAATYHAYLCRVPYGPSAGKPSPTDNTSYTSNAATTSAVQTCASGGAMSATVAGSAAVLFNAPAGLTIAGFRLWRSETVGPAVGGGGPFTKATYDTTPLEPDCNSGAGCTGRGDAGSRSRPATRWRSPP